ncbi:MAG: hypothetical protein LBQ54_09445 [Planctomycetaceae bacterium]|nr:hypothetical protein [Planctomycetaceae bacterium]
MPPAGRDAAAGGSLPVSARRSASDGKNIQRKANNTEGSILRKLQHRFFLRRKNRT